MANVTAYKLLEDTYANCFKLGGFLREVRGEKNDFAGKYSVKLATLNSLFDRTWIPIKTKSGHTKLQHRVTKVMINYQNHVNLVDPGAVTTIAEAIQVHINLFFEQFLGYSTKQINTRKPDYRHALKKLEMMQKLEANKTTKKE